MMKRIAFDPLRLACLLLLAALIGGCGSGDGGDSAREQVDAMSREHATDRGTPSGAAGDGPARPVISETLPYGEVDEELVYGHFVFPSDMIEPLPAVIMIHEWWGLNDGVRQMAERLAGEGYIVLAVDLFGGETSESPAGARKLMLEVLENPAPAEENLRQAYAFLRDTAGATSIASLGWCFGGAWSLNTALMFPEELDGAVIYYGQVISDPDRLGTLEMPVLGIFAAEDRGITVESVQAFEAALNALNIEHDVRIFPGVGHAFANPSGNNYDAAAAAEAWQLTLEFLDENLRPGG